MAKQLPKIEENFLPLLMSLKDGRKFLGFGSSPFPAIEKALEWSEMGLVHLDDDGYVAITSLGLETLDQQYKKAVNNFGIDNFNDEIDIEEVTPLCIPEPETDKEEIPVVDRELSLEERFFQRLVDLWHESNSTLRLHEFCGLTEEEYHKLVEKR